MLVNPILYVTRIHGVFRVVDIQVRDRVQLHKCDHERNN
jgi:hypothetical protein